MSAPKFSIIIPVYNAEMTITKTIDVLKELDDLTFEVLLINDGSHDNTEKAIKDSIVDDERFLLFTKKNEGPGLARNYGIEHAKGDYLLFFDADDYPEKTILKDYASIISANPNLDMIVSSFIFRTLNQEKIADEKKYLVDEYIYEDNKEFLSDMYSLMNKQLMYVVWNKCYRREIIVDNNIRFKNYRSCEDRIFNLDYYKHCSLVVMNSRVEYIYGFDGEQGITNQYSEEKFATFKEFYDRSNTITNNENREGMASLLLKGTTSVIFSVLGTKDIDKKGSRKEILRIYLDETIREASKIAEANTIMKKVFKIVYKLPIFVFYPTMRLFYQIQKNSPKLLANLKRKY